MQMTQPAITFLNMTGDVTITWDKENEESILALIEEKMKQGYSFFVLKPRKLGPVPLPMAPKHTKAKTISDVKAAGSVTVKDEDVLKMIPRKLDDPALESAVASGQAQLVAPSNVIPLESVRRAATPKEAVSEQTVAVRRVVGG